MRRAERAPKGSNMSNVAFIGLGAMGSRMAANLLRAGHVVTVCNLSPDAVKKLADSGATIAASARGAAEGKDFVITMVRDDEISRSVWLDATNGALTGVKPGAIAVGCPTITPMWARELGRAINKAASVSGSAPQTENAQLVFLVGGCRDAEARGNPAQGHGFQELGDLNMTAVVKLFETIKENA
jgi:3-hydroxyisobutyrate dehydrogenase